jgi:hypothetical protein
VYDAEIVIFNHHARILIKAGKTDLGGLFIRRLDPHRCDRLVKLSDHVLILVCIKDIATEVLQDADDLGQGIVIE